MDWEYLWNGLTMDRDLEMISDWTLILILDQILILIFNYYTQVEIGYMDLGKECLIKKDYKLDYKKNFIKHK